jgi:peptidoglycan/LPS O-acetylase OafA/YrhL
MSPRFISNIALAVAGAVVIVASQAFSTTVTGWLTFGVSLGALALLAIRRDRPRVRAQWMLDIAIGALALWSAVASVVYNGSTLNRLSFAEAIGFVALGVLGLVAHELEDERIVHEFYAIPAETRNGMHSEELEAAA